MLREVDLPDDDQFLARYPHQLSGGQQQRVAIAMAFGCRPRLVVLDEPTTGLDVTTQANVLRTVRELADTHRAAAVYVTHDLAVVAGLASRIVVMYAGRLVEEGPTDQILASPAHPYTRRLLRAIPDPTQRRPLVGIQGQVAPLGSFTTGCKFADRCDFAEDACRTEEIAEVSVDAGHRALCRRTDFVRSRPRVADADAAHEIRQIDSDDLLVVRDLYVAYGKHEVLHGAEFSILKGECLALVGESGSGKTTLARTISGLHAQATGDLRLNGEIVPWGSRHRTPQLLRRIQYIFQNPYSSLNPRKTLRELLEQPLRQFGLARGETRITELLEQVSLSPRYATRYPAQLSGGERQRVAIARALAAEPELLVCDEITSALDVSVQASILALLARLHAESGLTVLFVTHNLAVVRAIADDVIVLNEGVIVEAGPVERVLDAPQDGYTQALLRDTPAFAYAESS
jgi:peptide/nickel transport system ATP-binding protein